MGGSQSLPENKGDTQVILNFILREMFRRADLVDMYSLADPERCKNYIVVAAGALETFFSQINLRPKEGKKGLIYFQSIQGFLKGMSVQDREVHTQLCRSLAFYFIRIFQIFGALTLSVMDSTLPSVNPAPPVAKQKGYTPILPRPGLEGFPTKAQSGWFGGALSNDPRSTRSTFYIGTASGTEDYRILNQYLNVPSDGSSSAGPMFFDRSSMQIPQNTLYDGVGDPATRTLKAAPTPMVLYPFKDLNTPKNITARLIITVESETYTILLTAIKIGTAAATKTTEIKRTLTAKYAGDESPEDAKGNELPAVLKDMFNEIISNELGFSPIQFLSDQKYISDLEPNTAIRGTRITVDNPKESFRAQSIPITYTDSVKVEGRSTDVRVKANLQISKGSDSVTSKKKYTVRIDFSKATVRPESIASAFDFSSNKMREFTGSSEPVDTYGKKIPTFLQEVFEKIFKAVKEGRTRTGIQYTRKGLPVPYASERIPEPLRVDALWKALAKDPPVKAHCVARALQLLNVQAIRGEINDTDYSSICNTKFPLIQDKSLPPVNGPIVEEYAIGALANLFVDGLIGNMPRVTDSTEYSQLLQQLQTSFGDSTEAPAGSIAAVKDSSKGACTSNGIITVKGSLRSTLRDAAVRLINRQNSHMRGVMNIIFSLFNEQRVRAGIFEIHPNVVRGGMEEVNRIAKDARELLIKYYSDCESTYKEGVDAIAASKPAVNPSNSAPPENIVSGPDTTEEAANEVRDIEENEDDNAP